MSYFADNQTNKQNNAGFSADVIIINTSCILDHVHNTLLDLTCNYLACIHTKGQIISNCIFIAAIMTPSLFYPCPWLPLGQPMNARHAMMLCNTARLLIAIVCNIISEPAEGGVMHPVLLFECWPGRQYIKYSKRKRTVDLPLRRLPPLPLACKRSVVFFRHAVAIFFQLICTRVFLRDGE